MIIVLQWNDKFGLSGNDYDLGLYSYGAGQYVAVSAAPQDGDDNPLEAFSYTVPTGTATCDYLVVVEKYSGVEKTLEVFIYPSSGVGVYTNNITPVDAVFGHAAVPNALAVGAIAADDPGNDDIELFSSHGPSTISYPTSESRSKPDICGIDGVSVTGSGGFPSTFYGTSAAAPHVAALAAQSWGAFPDKTGDEVRDALKSSAVDLGTAGFDNVFGYGRADAWYVYETLPVELSSFTARTGNGAVTLHWATQSEIDNLGFHVYRALSEDGKYERLTADLIEGAGNSAAKQEYSFADVRLTNGITYWYKLEDVAFDGMTQMHGPIPVTPKGEQIAEMQALPEAFGLTQNFPNPFNPFTEIQYQLPEASRVELVIYDVLGREVRRLVDGTVQAGYHSIQWRGEDRHHRTVGSGIYLYRLETEDFVETRRMLLLR